MPQAFVLESLAHLLEGNLFTTSGLRVVNRHVGDEQKLKNPFVCFTFTRIDSTLHCFTLLHLFLQLWHRAVQTTLSILFIPHASDSCDRLLAVNWWHLHFKEVKAISC